MNDTLRAVQQTFNECFRAHKRFPVDADQLLARTERVSLVLGTAHRPIVALSIEQKSELLHIALQTDKTLPPALRARLELDAAEFIQRVKRIPGIAND